MTEYKVLEPVKILKKTYFVFFSSIAWGLFTGFYGENFNFFSSNILNLPLVPVLNPKSSIFSHLVPVQSQNTS
jgi:hypothetical protein